MKIWENNITQLYDPANRQEKLEVEIEEEENADEKDPYMLQTKLEKAIKEMKDKKRLQVMVMYLGMYLDYWESTVSEQWNNWSTTYMKLKSGPRISLKLQPLP